MISEHAREFLLDAVKRYRDSVNDLYDHINTTTKAEVGNAADYMCAAIEAFLEDDNESYRDRLNTACWNGEEPPTDESMLAELKARAEELAPGICSEERKTLDELREQFKPITRPRKSLTEEDRRSIEEFVEKIKNKNND